MNIIIKMNSNQIFVFYTNLIFIYLLKAEQNHNSSHGGIYPIRELEFLLIKKTSCSS